MFYIPSNLNKNHYFLIGILSGLLFSIYIPQEIRELSKDCPQDEDNMDKYANEFEPQLNLAQKPLAAKKVIKNIIRPRYYSSELGIREKLFVGVMTKQENIDTLATAFNKTSAHLVNKIKFFINADDVKSNFRLKNIVGFTDNRENLKPFHVLKYIADNYLNDYDYFLLTSDQTYLDARKLKEKLFHISISFDLYMGRPLYENDESNDYNGRNYCDLNAGIILSSSVIKKMHANLDWCVRNAVTNFHSLNIGKCVKYSSEIDYCQTSWQGIDINSYKLINHKIYRDLHFLKKELEFNNAIVVYPITTPDDYYLLHIYYSRLHLESLQQQQKANENEAVLISNGSIPNDILEIRWPLGVPQSEAPETRHDIISWTYMNLTHSLMWDNEHNVKELPKIEQDDIARILNRTILKATKNYPDLEFLSLHSAYRKFDPVRGMDYKILINFQDKTKNKNIIKNYEIVKPLGLVEIVPSPYVTESTRITMILPIFGHQVKESLEFINRYEKTCMESQDSTLLMLVFMYPIEAPSKGLDDIFGQLKTISINLTEKYKNDGSRIQWVSIRMPSEFSNSAKPEDVVLTSIYGKNEILSLAATDLALRKIGLDSLIMVASNSMTFRADFLNRVRMNTIQNFQIYSPIAFMLYPCEWSSLCKPCDTCDVGQSYGYFDRSNYDVISFYSRDYVEARKKLEPVLPIVRNDPDVVNLLSRSAIEINSIIDMFVKSQTNIHILRAIEPNLRFGLTIKNYLSTHETLPECNLHTNEDSRKCIKFSSKKQIGNAVLQFEEEILNII